MVTVLSGSVYVIKCRISCLSVLRVFITWSVKFLYKIIFGKSFQFTMVFPGTRAVNNWIPCCVCVYYGNLRLLFYIHHSSYVCVWKKRSCFYQNAKCIHVTLINQPINRVTPSTRKPTEQLPSILCNRRFIIVFTRVRRWSVHWEADESSPRPTIYIYIYIYIRFILCGSYYSPRNWGSVVNTVTRLRVVGTEFESR